MSSPTQSRRRFSKQGFQVLNDPREPPASGMASKSSTVDIPLQQVISHGASEGPGNMNKGAFDEKSQGKPGLFHRGAQGRRRNKSASTESKGEKSGGEENDGEFVTKLGKFYYAILNFSIVTRYFIYVAPLAIVFAIPIIYGAVGNPQAKIDNQVRLVWFFTWVEILWLSLWVSKIFAHFLPRIFQFFAGVVSSGTRKYALILKALEIPISLVGWSVTSLLTFTPLMIHNPDNSKNGPKEFANWQNVLRQVLAAVMISTLVLLIEKLLVQLISINYHRKQFNTKIKDSKRNIHLLGLLYDASRALFPAYCNEFAEEDYIINDSINLSLGKSKKNSGTATPMRLLQDVGRFGDKLTAAFGNVAHEITGKKVFNPDSAHSIVVEALEKQKSSEALARRLWMSFVVEGKEALYQEDIIEVLGSGRQAEAEECFASLDRDNNGDISLDEMILTVTEFGRERKSIASSMHDVDQAIHVLDGLLSAIVFIICIFIFVAFLNADFTTTLATTGTALLSLSFVFASTAQEFLGSCIFLFVKHPYDIGDRVDLKDEQLTVEHISLLFTVFKRVTNGKLVQIPNIVLNSVWIENVSRSKAMREQVSLYVNFETTFEDITALKNEMQAFVLDKENNRDFQPDIDIEVLGVDKMDKMELKIEIRHKSNWGNETLRAARRSKFMCALVLALRKVPIYGPGAGDAVLGDASKPTYSVAISDQQAKQNKETFATNKEAKRLFPSKKPDEDHKDGPGGRGSQAEISAVDKLNTRPPAVDVGRDDTWAESRDDGSTLGRTSIDRPELDEVRGILRKETLRGKRRNGSVSNSNIPSIVEPQAQPPASQPSTSRPPTSQTQTPQPPATLPAYTFLPPRETTGPNPSGAGSTQPGPHGANMTIRPAGSSTQMASVYSRQGPQQPPPPRNAFAQASAQQQSSARAPPRDPRSRSRSPPDEPDWSVYRGT